MKKFLILSLVLVMVVCCFASCDNSRTEIEITDSNGNSIEVSDPFVTTYCVKDTHGNVIKHIMFNRNTKLTYIYDYEWVYDYGVFVCTNQWLTILDEKGNELPDEPQVSVNGCTCIGSSGDAYNDIYPGYKVPECNCTGGTETNKKPESSTTAPNNDTHDPIEPCVIYNKKNIVVTITAGSYNEIFEVWEYTLKIENGSTHNILINSTDESFGNMMLSDLFGLYETVPAGKTKMSTLNFWNMEDLGITELRGILTMTIEVSDSDTYDTMDETIVNIEFK